MENQRSERFHASDSFLLNGNTTYEPIDNNISPRTTAGPIPLSFSQQRLWFLDRLVPGSALYNVFNIIRFSFIVNRDILQKALQEIVRRHEALRTHFSTLEGQPIQIVDQDVPLFLPLTDLRTIATRERQTELQRLVNEEAQKPFDLAKGPLIRASLIRTDDQAYIFTITMHHIITDGWSMGIFFKELSSLYEAYSRGLPSPLAELPIQFPDFAIWQRHWLTGDVLGKQLQYWKTKLANVPHIELPLDFPRAAVQTFRGAVKAFKLPDEHYLACRRICQETNCTMFMVLLTVFKILIFRLSGQQDLAIGSPISGRNRTRIEGLIGFFVNTVVIRTQLAGHQNFLQILDNIRVTCLEAYSHQDLPFEMAVDEVHPERDLSRNPLFQIMFQVLTGQQNNTSTESDKFFPKVTVNTSKFDLTISFNDGPDTLTGSIEYNTDLFRAETIDTFIHLYGLLLTQVITHPQKPAGDLSLLYPEEKQRLEEQWKNNNTPYPADQTIPFLFDKAAALHAAAVAVGGEGETLTYATLASRANQLAHFLIHQGITPEQPVGVFMERSANMVTALLGILKAGGVYMPLDLAYPHERILYMMGDAQLAVVLADSPLPDTLQGPAAIVLSPTFWEEINDYPTTPPAVHITPRHLAYIMYTSGSTGHPKGICVPHQAVVRLLFNTNYIQIRPTDAIAHASNTAFDAAVFEIWGALLHGAQLILVPPKVNIEPAAYASFIEEHGINTLFLTTALLNQFAQQAPWGFRSVRQLIFGGEAATAHWVREILQNSPLQRLVHVYGPTEGTTFSSWYEVRTVPAGDTTVPIGEALSNTTLYVLDENLAWVPKGMPGELYIGGDGLARGYWRRPDVTATSFLPDPFSARPGARMYRTGDVVRVREDGLIDFIKRKDRQIKLRGFRIELSEIEWNLRQYDQISECVVTVINESGDNKRIVAYLKPKATAPLDVDALRLHLRTHIPEYMIPAVFIAVEDFPLNANGKIDMAKLPQFGDGKSINTFTNTRMAPGTAGEKIIGNIWKEVLQLEEVGVHDNFFDLGGHSLLIAKVHARLNDEFKCEIPLIDLFRYPTIRNLSEHIEQLPRKTEETAHHDLQHINDRMAKQKQSLMLSRQRQHKI